MKLYSLVFRHLSAFDDLLLRHLTHFEFGFSGSLRPDANEKMLKMREAFESDW
jgi:hypothetical protein